MKRFIEKTEHFLRRMRWKANHFLNQQETSAKDTYGFKSKNSPPKINELIPFEDGMLDLIRNIKFKDDTKSNFQRKLDADIKSKIKKPNSLLIPADKTTNYYEMNTSAYDKLIKENVTKTYKKSSGKVVEKLNAQSAKIAEHLKSCKFHVLYAYTGDACALETRRRFVTEHEKKRKPKFQPRPHSLGKNIPVGYSFIC